MKTVADLKRTIKVGVKLASTYHLKFAGHEDGKTLYQDEYKGIREVTISSPTQFALKTFYTKDNIYRDSFMPWPKRDEVIFNSDGSFTIQEKDDRTGQWVKIITYSIQPETASQVEFFGDKTANFDKSTIGERLADKLVQI